MKKKAKPKTAVEKYILGSPNKQKAYISTLADMYYGHMEGCDYESFVKWSSLYCAASMILKAMKEEVEPDITF